MSGRISGLDMPRRPDIRLVLSAISTPAGMPRRSGEMDVLANGQTGNFEIHDLYPGLYKLTVPRTPGTFSGGLDAEFPGASAVFEVGTADISNLELRFEPTASKTGPSQ